MATLAQPTHTHDLSLHNTTANWRRALMTFFDKADFYRFGWSATAALIQGCLLTPALILALSINHGPDWHFLAGYICFLGVLITILSAMPVRYILSAFSISLFIHLCLIAYNVF